MILENLPSKKSCGKPECTANRTRHSSLKTSKNGPFSKFGNSFIHRRLDATCESKNKSKNGVFCLSVFPPCIEKESGGRNRRGRKGHHVWGPSLLLSNPNGNSSSITHPYLSRAQHCTGHTLCHVVSGIVFTGNFESRRHYNTQALCHI